MAAESKYVALRLPDGTWYQLRDLPWLEIEEIERRHGTSWVIVLDMPQVNGGVLADVARAVHMVNDLEPPVLDTARDMIELSDRLGLVDEQGREVLEDAAAQAEPEVQYTNPIAWSPARV